MSRVPTDIILDIPVQRLIFVSCLAYLAHARDVITETPIVESIPVVLRYFQHIFLGCHKCQTLILQ